MKRTLLLAAAAAPAAWFGYTLYGSSDPDGGPGGRAASATPTWSALDQRPAGCTVERSPGRWRAFEWTPCEEAGERQSAESAPSAKSSAPARGCERAAFSPALGVELLGANTTVREQDGSARLGLAFAGGPHRGVVFADADGWSTDAYRVTLKPDGCMLSINEGWRERYGAVVVSSPAAASPAAPDTLRLGGILHRTGAEGPPTIFDLPSPPPGYGPGAHPMSERRWLWHYTPDKLVSVSTETGTDLTLVAGPVDKGPLLALGHPISIGPMFLFGQVDTGEDGVNGTSSDDGAGGKVSGARGYIASSDGVHPPTPFLVAPDTSWYDRPVHADSHLGFLRGFNPSGPNRFTRVEVWASPFSTDPSQLRPFKVADYGLPAMSAFAGGHGRLAAPSGHDTQTLSEIDVWDLSKGTHTTVVLPAGRRLFALVGLTSRHLWALTTTGRGKPPDALVRIALDGP